MTEMEIMRNILEKENPPRKDELSEKLRLEQERIIQVDKYFKGPSQRRNDLLMILKSFLKKDDYNKVINYKPNDEYDDWNDNQ